jgi:hypothetical protein
MNQPKKRGQPASKKAMGILLYAGYCASLRGSGRLLDVSTVAVLKWVRTFAKTLERPKIPMPPEGVIVVIDEMGHFVNGKPNKVWIWKAYDLKERKVFAWKLGDRSA